MINLRVNNRALSVSNLSITENMMSARLIADSPLGSGTISVDNVNGFSVGKYMLIGEWGDPTAEIVKVHASTAPSGTTITLSANTAFDHYADTPVTLINYNEVEFSRATTATGEKSVLATQGIYANKTETIYVDLTNSTGFAFARFKNGTDFSEYSSAINYTGAEYTEAGEIIRSACQMQGVSVGGEFAEEDVLLSDLNKAIDDITKLDWVFELIKDESSISLSQNENKYPLSQLTREIKYSDTAQGIKSVLVVNKPIEYIEQDDMEELLSDSVRSELAVGIEIGDTTITLTSSAEFAAKGSVKVGEFTAYYTANDTATGVLSGITAFTGTVASGASVWQNTAVGVPTKYTIIDGNIILNAPVQENNAGFKLRTTYLKKIPRVTDFASSVELPFVNELELYVSARIERRKRNFEESGSLMKQYKNGIVEQYQKYRLPQMEETNYYIF